MRHLQKNKLVDNFAERHSVRFFFPEELKCLLKECGFKINGIYPFLTFKNKLSVKEWDLVAVATLDS